MQPRQSRPLGRRRCVPQAAASSSNGSSSSSRADEMPQPTPEEMASAQAALKDFLHGMGSGGRTQRPADMPGGEDAEALQPCYTAKLQPV